MFHNPQKLNCAYRHHTSWCSGILTEKGWSSDFPPLPSAFSPKRAMAWFSENKAECIRALSSANAIEQSSMAFMLRSHNGVHCCGTVGDSHSSSQLSTAKCTFTGDSFQNHDARTGNPFSQFHGKGTKKYAKSKRKSNFSARHERFSHGGNDLFPGCGFSATKLRIQFEIVQSETGIIFAIRVFPMCWSR